MDNYDLINSKAIGNYCRKIKHKFNTEELAVLIYRCKKISIEEKITLYNELINDYPDMEVIKRVNCKHYDSVKDMIKSEIARLQNLIKILKKEESNVVYSYNYYCKCSNRSYGIIQGKNEYIDIYKTYKEVIKLINKEIQEDEDKEILSFSIRKRTVSNTNKCDIRAEYLLDENRNIKMVNIYNFENEWLDISNICLNIPTPFKKGDLLISNSLSPFMEGFILDYDEFPFVLEYLCNWNNKFQDLLDRGNHDSSDMQGMGYLVSEEGFLYADNVFNYDNWEYFNGELEGKSRILKAVSSFIKKDISLDLFVHAYDFFKTEDNRHMLQFYTDEGLKAIGLSDLDIAKIK